MLHRALFTTLLGLSLPDRYSIIPLHLMHRALLPITDLWKALPPMNISSLTMVKTIKDDLWNRVPGGSVHVQMFTEDGSTVGDFDYRTATGQVGGMFLTEDFQGRALEQQMLIYAMHDMKAAGARDIWEVVVNENGPSSYFHRPKFYSRLWKFRYCSPVHDSVTGSGYTMRIPNDPQSLPIIPGVGIY